MKKGVEEEEEEVEEEGKLAVRDVRISCVFDYACTTVRRLRTTYGSWLRVWISQLFFSLTDRPPTSFLLSACSSCSLTLSHTSARFHRVLVHPSEWDERTTRPNPRRYHAVFFATSSFCPSASPFATTNFVPSSSIYLYASFRVNLPSGKAALSSMDARSLL